MWLLLHDGVAPRALYFEVSAIIVTTALLLKSAAVLLHLAPDAEEDIGTAAQRLLRWFLVITVFITAGWVILY